ncbi:MAG TPA: tetratricopeptide repeat protein [Polyangiaceae bacterium]|jgi:TolA-binding protein
MSKPERNESIAAAFGELVREAQARQPVDEAAGRTRLLLSAAQPEARAASRRVWWIGLPALAGAALLAAFWFTPGKLRYEVVGASESGAYVSAPADHTVALNFSDQTQVIVARSSQLRVEETSRRGARVLVERGTADVHVVHRDGANWTFAAGPFEVHVTGTRFDLAWDPAKQVFDLGLREGSVEIQSPLSPAPTALRAGQHFHGDLAARAMLTTETNAALSSASSAAVSVSAAPSAAVSPNSALPAASAAALDSAPNTDALGANPSYVAPASSARSWSKLVAAGDFKAVLAQANERGVSGCEQACSAPDLSALADAARYTGHSDIAEQSLRALRARFASTTEGRSAAFLLGRVREAQGAQSDANSWYARYLSESPSGPYAAEALAGKMRTTLAVSGQAAAAPIAQEYLARYPNGVHAGTARSILAPH